jgi:WD40 repeat protein
VAAWSPDAKTFAVARGDRQATVELWEAESGKPLPCLARQIKCQLIEALAWSPDGRTMASGGPGSAIIRLWDTRTGELLRSFGGSWQSVLRLAWSADGKTLAACSEQGELALWDAGSGQEHPGINPNLKVRRMAWSPAGKVLALGGLGPDHDVEIWRWEGDSGKLLHPLHLPHKPPGDVLALAWSSDGTVLASSGMYDRTVCLWEAATGKVLKTLPEKGVPSLAWSPDGKTLAIVKGGSGEIRLWEPKSEEPPRVLEGSRCSYVDWSHDGRTLATSELSLWEADSGKLLHRLSPSDRYVVWSPDDRTVATWGSVVNFWEAKSGRRQATLITLEGGHWLVLSPEGYFRGSTGIEKMLHVVVQSEKGQQTLSVEEFGRQYGWKNDPDRVRPTGP